MTDPSLIPAENATIPRQNKKPSKTPQPRLFGSLMTNLSALVIAVTTADMTTRAITGGLVRGELYLPVFFLLLGVGTFGVSVLRWRGDLLNHREKEANR
ncbi:hypothetical protein [Frigoribacterium sp. SL97]|uniref:hypothetical protein n=1 Tax=Frigoribacterium sp. SL97 TaxID=2994664 RepID=UPI00226E9252|nr:hypothetical protein [Frigoribacterium sp. SL97]WAC50443.1 hypothetical protein OVA02_11230 [Frigoribacterium sp. SL97]